MSQRQRKQAEKVGRRAETLAAILLRIKGYQILAHGYRTAVGEIDIIALRRNTLVVVEVKARAGLRDSLEAVTQRQRQRIERAIGLYIAENAWLQTHDIRFDVIAVRPLASLSWPKHIEDAWRPDWN